MAIICPSCDARFREPEIELPKTRALQCGKCEHEWVPADLEAEHVRRSINRGERAAVPPPPTQPGMEDLIANKSNAIETGLPVIIPGETAKDVPSKPVIDMPVREPLFVDREPMPAQPRSRAGLFAFAGLACISLLAGAIALKAEIIRYIPQSQPLYALAGLATETDGLKIANVETRKTKLDGIGQLIVEGEIQNVADHSIPVPPLKLTMRGEKSDRLYAWTVAPVKTTLNPGESSGFTAIANDYPDGAVNVEVVFAPRKKPAN